MSILPYMAHPRIVNCNCSQGALNHEVSKACYDSLDRVHVTWESTKVSVLALQSLGSSLKARIDKAVLITWVEFEAG